MLFAYYLLLSLVLVSAASIPALLRALGRWSLPARIAIAAGSSGLMFVAIVLGISIASLGSFADNSASPTPLSLAVFGTLGVGFIPLWVATAARPGQRSAQAFRLALLIPVVPMVVVLNAVIPTPYPTFVLTLFGSSLGLVWALPFEGVLSGVRERLVTAAGAATLLYWPVILAIGESNGVGDSLPRTAAILAVIAGSAWLLDAYLRLKSPRLATEFRRAFLILLAAATAVAFALTTQDALRCEDDDCVSFPGLVDLLAVITVVSTPSIVWLFIVRPGDPEPQGCEG